jgi:hypothetical protein
VYILSKLNGTPRPSGTGYRENRSDLEKSTARRQASRDRAMAAAVTARLAGVFDDALFVC